MFLVGVFFLYSLSYTLSLLLLPSSRRTTTPMHTNKYTPPTPCDLWSARAYVVTGIMGNRDMAAPVKLELVDSTLGKVGACFNNTYISNKT